MPFAMRKLIARATASDDHGAVIERHADDVQAVVSDRPAVRLAFVSKNELLPAARAGEACQCLEHRFCRCP